MGVICGLSKSPLLAFLVLLFLLLLASCPASSASSFYSWSPLLIFSEPGDNVSSQGDHVSSQGDIVSSQGEVRSPDISPVAATEVRSPDVFPGAEVRSPNVTSTVAAEVRSPDVSPVAEEVRSPNVSPVAEEVRSPNVSPVAATQVRSPNVSPVAATQVRSPILSSVRAKRHLGSACNQDLFVGIVLQTDKTMETIHEIKEPFTVANLNSSWDEVATTIPSIIDPTFMELCDLDQTCSRILPVLPRGPHLPPDDHQALQLHLSRSLELVWSFLMAHEQIMLDQSLYEDGVFMKELNRVYLEYEVLSIFLSEAATHCHAFPDDSALRDLLEKMHTKTVKLSRSLRGFGVFRQSLIGLQYIKTVFSGVAAEGIPPGLEDDGTTHNTRLKLGREVETGEENVAEWMETTDGGREGVKPVAGGGRRKLEGMVLTEEEKGKETAEDGYVMMEEEEEDEERIELKEEEEEEEEEVEVMLKRGKLRGRRNREPNSRKLIRKERVAETEAEEEEEEEEEENTDRRGNRREKSRRKKRRNRQKTNRKGTRRQHRSGREMRD
ncbi:hypothetical protein Pmani_006403 [Petrolisthes manimaculis]|uniref:Uncharacterized protein n=1 Tax=Petrolisthes manimaculis TaxID=1843537 RepID=A0AAE1QAF4_9EUCA|nr:hypothetical protein Pmani_006403 [Petrolisthes manimaculis]